MLVDRSYSTMLSVQLKRELLVVLLDLLVRRCAVEAQDLEGVVGDSADRDWSVRYPHAQDREQSPSGGKEGDTGHAGSGRFGLLRRGMCRLNVLRPRCERFC